MGKHLVTMYNHVVLYLVLVCLMLWRFIVLVYHLMFFLLCNAIMWYFCICILSILMCHSFYVLVSHTIIVILVGNCALTWFIVLPKLCEYLYGCITCNWWPPVCVECLAGSTMYHCSMVLLSTPCQCMLIVTSSFIRGNPHVFQICFLGQKAGAPEIC